jgi:hypothetical protein
LPPGRTVLGTLHATKGSKSCPNFVVFFCMMVFLICNQTSWMPSGWASKAVVVRWCGHALFTDP